MKDSTTNVISMLGLLFLGFVIGALFEGVFHIDEDQIQTKIDNGNMLDFVALCRFSAGIVIDTPEATACFFETANPNDVDSFFFEKKEKTK